MSDADLEAIRSARLQQLQSQQGGPRAGGAGSPGPNGGGGASQEEQQKSREQEARASILSQILEPFAADRLGRIRMVNQKRAEDVENRLIMLARSGQLRQRVTEEQLKEILSAVAEQQSKTEGEGGAGSVRVQRTKGRWDEDDLDDLLSED